MWLSVGACPTLDNASVLPGSNRATLSRTISEMLCRWPPNQVLSTLAAALGLDEVETEHLQRLARGHRRNTSTPARHHVRSEVAAILGRFDDLPALVLGRSLEALAWTPVAATLLGLRADRERNMARRLFLCPDTRRLYPDWATVAAETVAHLRRIAVQHPLDPATTGLVVELSCASRGALVTPRGQRCAARR